MCTVAPLSPTQFFEHLLQIPAGAASVYSGATVAHPVFEHLLKIPAGAASVYSGATFASNVTVSHFFLERRKSPTLAFSDKKWQFSFRIVFLL